jgi:hypothetical protein
MSFLDKAKAAANDLAAKADTALGSSGMGGPKASAGDADAHFRDLGVLAYLEANGRPADPQAHQRVMTTLQEMDARGAIHSFALHTAPPPPPGTGGMAGQTGRGGFPPPPGAAGSSVPPPPGGAAPQPPAPPAASSTPPPPPPSWMNKDGDDKG